MKYNNIQRYEWKLRNFVTGVQDPNEDLHKNSMVFLTYQESKKIVSILDVEKDHLKAMEELSYELNISLGREQDQAKEIANLNAHQKQLETGFDKQAKEIERLEKSLREAHKKYDILWSEVNHD